MASLTFMSKSYGPQTPMKREDPLQQFETGRIKHLQEERLHIQKKTFTKWINSFLNKARLEVFDLFTDLADGKMLLKLLEIISGEKLGKPNNGKMRVHKVENVNKSLAFLHTKVRLESIGAEDIVDGNPRLILGLIWTIILRFHIQEIEINLDEENESSEKKSAKDALLLWCQRRTAGYRGVQIQDFTGSWRSGLGFNALIHSHRPDLVDYSEVHTRSNIDNLNNAFGIAHQELGIARILDAEDVDTNKPDEKSIITYVASYYHTFAKMRNEMKGSRRIANIMTQMKDVDDTKDKYEGIATTLLEWIRQKILQLNDYTFPNSLDGIQKLLIEFKTYRTEEKPPKYMECSEIEALYFAINASLKGLNRPIYSPKDGYLVKDIEREWQKLEKAENRREVALRDELLRQERLEHLAFKFEKKGLLRKGYLEEMIQVLSDSRYGSNLSQVDATVKKHEAISADILAREERFDDLSKMANELDVENYHDKDRIRQKESAILEKWKALLTLLDKHKNNLLLSSQLMALIREADTILLSIQELATNLRSVDDGGFLMAVEDLIQKHALMETQAKSMGETIRRLNKQCTDFINKGNSIKDIALLKNKLTQLNTEHENLLKLAAVRRDKLEDARNLYVFQADMKEEEAWVIEKQRICQAVFSPKDIRAVMSLQQKHKALQDEMNARKAKTDSIIKNGENLCQNSHPYSQSIQQEIDSLLQNWKDLQVLMAARKKLLQDAVEAYSFVADANEADSWINEKIPLVSSQDFGEDELSAQALLQLNGRLLGEIKAYDNDIKSINQMGTKLIQRGIQSLNLASAQPATEELVSEYVDELVPQEYWEELVTEREEVEFVTEEKLMDMVKARYTFEGQGMSMDKGEEMFLLNKTNDDWWNVRKVSGEEGFGPANYLKDIEPRLVKLRVRKTKKIPIKERVKKTRMVKQRVMKEKPKAPPRKKIQEEGETVDQRLVCINTSFDKLKQLAEKRTKLLQDSIRLFLFYRECVDFDHWMREQEKQLKTEDPKEDVESAKRKFEQFLTDMSAAGKRIEIIDKMADDLKASDNSQIDKVLARQRQIHDQWNHLNRLKQQKERSLEGASSVDLFHRTCDETRDWMIEKMEKVDTDALGYDLKTIQALQRKHDQLERELAPIQDKVQKVSNLGNSVKSSYPHEREKVKNRQEEIQGLWQQLKNKAIDRRDRLEEAVGSEIFTSSSKNLLNWVSGVKQILNADEAAKDVSTAEKFLENHAELGDDIRTHEDEFKEVNGLGNSLVARNPDLQEVKEKLTQLAEEEQAVNRGWQEKGDWLRQCLDLQLFNREADHIDAATSSHLTFLAFTDLGSTLDDVEALLKRHDDFENTLIAQDERLRTFSEMADKLTAANHYDSRNIIDRKNDVLAKRKSVKEKADTRRAMLDRSMSYQQFKADADDFDSWMSDKMKCAEDDSYKDLNNLERKLQKHDAFESELRANQGQLRRLNKTGTDLISMDHYRSDDISDTLKQLNDKWETLFERTQEKRNNLQQAYDQMNYNKKLDETAKSLDNVDAALKNKDVGSDLRSCKQLLSKQSNLENEMVILEKRIADFLQTSQEMSHYGHFDAENIVIQSKACKDRFHKLKVPLAARRAALQEALLYHEFKFQVEVELQWINDHIPAATSQTVGHTLHEAQSLQKKHLKLKDELEGHRPQIDKTLDKGKHLIEDKHPQKDQIESLCNDLTESWSNLDDACARRSHQLELNMRAQNYFFEANDVESWMAEKRKLLETKDFGKDDDAARRMLTKHKALELEIDTYSGLIKEVGSMADKMVKDNHPESKLIKDRQQVINHELKEVQKLSTNRRQKLMESMYRHEYLREAGELETWIAEQMVTASSEEYGHDYEHLLVLQSKFDDFKHSVEAGSERFTQCEDLAIKLVANDNPYAGSIENKKDELGAAWATLLDRIRERDEKLEAAGEIHRFNRDVAEALSRIQEKYKSIPDYLGKGVNSVQALMRKHEGFENDLVALEAQLQVLVDDAARLQEKYPGTNTEHIAEQQSTVVNNWNALQEKALQRRNQLQEAEKLHKFLADSRDLMSWSNDLRSSMKTHEKVRDAASAQLLKGEHENIKAEIEAREDVFQKVVDKGKLMIDDNHYASQEIQDRVDKVLEERSQLHSAWQNKKVYLDQLIDLQFFLRDVKQLESLCIAQEATLSTSECGTTIEQVDAMVKKHAAFQKLVDAQEDRLHLLKIHGSKLIEQNHFYSPNIKSHIEEVSDRRNAVKKASRARKQQLEDALLFAQFSRDVADANVWIDEKNVYLDNEKQGGDITSFEDKVKKLQRHQTFMAELQAHQCRIEQISDKGNLLITKKHDASSQVSSQVKDLNVAWKKLVESSQIYFRGLEEAQDILEFTTQVDKIEAWIRDKEMLVQAGDLGNDYEHCLSLKRKLEDVDSDMRVDDARFVKLNKLADKIISQGKGDHKVQERRDQLNQKWSSLKGSIDKYRTDLVGALQIHELTRDMDDTRQRINEKLVMLTAEDTGRDLHQVETLQRKQDNVMRDMSVIEKKIRQHADRAQQLGSKYPAKQETINKKLDEVNSDWDTLNQACVDRQRVLGSSYTLHKFQVDMKELNKWVDATIASIESTLPTSTAQAKVLLEEHQEKKAEIDGRKNVFNSLCKFGEKILRENAAAEETVATNLVKIKQMEKDVNDAWSKRQKQLKQAQELQIFVELAQQAKSWIASKEAFLANDDLGDSIATVDTLIRKHENFEKTLEAQYGRINELEDKASKLISNDHYDKAGIEAEIQLIVDKKDNLTKVSQARKQKLAESKSLHQFLRNLYEVDGWIFEKQQVVNDESYRDLSNLQAKIQKHAALEAELSTNSARIASVTQLGEDLLSEGHFAASEIESNIGRLTNSWKQLLDASSLKKKRLDQAYQALIFGRTMDDLDAWMDDTELTLQSEDHGKDLASVQHLIQKHQLLEQSISARQADIDQGRQTAQNLIKDHFMADIIQERIKGICNRYESLHEPVQIRRENLSDASRLHQLLRDFDDELQWMQEKQPHIFSQDLGSSLPQVQNLLKKHQGVEAELQSHEPVILSINGRAQQMIRSSHFASSQIEEKSNEVLNLLALLKDKASVRRLRLLDAIESQMFFCDANESSAWMEDKKSVLSSQDFGKDEASVLALTKKLDSLANELNTFTGTIEKLDRQSSKLIERAHFDADNIKSKMESLKSDFAELHRLKDARAAGLSEKLEFFKFMLESDGVLDWLNEQMAVAASEDYGQDVEHIQILIQKYESFMASLTANSNKPKLISAQAEKLKDNGHSQSQIISDRANEVVQLWEDLTELANARQEALAGAKQVHVFDRNADETCAWILEKIAVVASEDYGHDLDAIQSLARKHQGFERDLDAVKDQVEIVNKEAARLTELFPEAQMHIKVKHESTLDVWRQLLDKSAQRKDKLNQAEQIQSYFDEYRDLIAWINEMLAKITSPELPKDVSACEAVLSRHNEYRTEIDARADSLAKFVSTGQSLVKEGHFMSEEIEEKVKVLEARNSTLLQCWESRKRLYHNNLDLRMFLRDAQLIEAWIESREAMVHNDYLGDSITETEELLRKHDDFLKMIDSQDDKLDPIKRLTLIEEDFKDQIRKEEETRKAELARKEQERLTALKRKEVSRITDARRREDERRRTQEIKLPDVEASHQLNGDYISARDQDELSVNSHDSTSDERSESDDDTSPPIRDDLDKGMLKPAGSHSSLNSLNRGNLTLRQELFRHSLRPFKSPSDVKRAESMKIDLKKPKRTPSFTTRRRTQSFRKHKRMEALDNLPPVECQGYLERKQELQTGGKKATIRSWKLFYTVLCGQLMCFFKDEEDFFEQKAASSPVSIYQARVEKAEDYTKRKNVFRVMTRDGAEYLCLAPSDVVMEEWVSKLSFHAQLAPSMQLLSYDNHKEPDGSDVSANARSQTSMSTFGPTGPNKASVVTIKGHHNPLYANVEAGPAYGKPPVPARSHVTASRVATLPPTDQGPIYQNRISIISPYEDTTGGESMYQNIEDNRIRTSVKSLDEDVPPLPTSAPPVQTRTAAPRSNRLVSFPAWASKSHVNKHTVPPNTRYIHEDPRIAYGQTPPVAYHPSRYPPPTGAGAIRADSMDGVPGSRQPISEFSARALSLPHGATPPMDYDDHKHSVALPADRNESSSESDMPSTNGKEKRKGSMFKFLSRRKGAQV